MQQSESVAGVIRLLGLKVSGGAYQLMNVHIKRLELDVSHFLGQAHLRGKRHGWTKAIPLDEILVEHSTFDRGHLKKKLIAEGLLEERCAECKLTHWRGVKLSLHLDHKNGVFDDHRLENLRLLCPNCHSITPTYSRGAKGLSSERNAFSLE